VSSVPPSIKTRQVGTPPVVVVSLTGEHDTSTAGNLEQTLMPLVLSGSPVVVDLSGLTFAESAILGILVMAAKVAQREGFGVVAPPESPAARLFDLVDARAVFAVYPTVEMAVDRWRDRAAG
jgi:anti-anti-sigma factor